MHADYSKKGVCVCARPVFLLGIASPEQLGDVRAMDQGGRTSCSLAFTLVCVLAALVVVVVVVVVVLR